MGANMRPTALLVGVIIAVAGAAGVSYVQLGIPDPVRVGMILESGETMELEGILDAPDVGFFGIVLEEPRAAAQVIIVSPAGAELVDEIVYTRQSVDYFDLDGDGTYTLRATLVSARDSHVSAELGQVASAETMYPAAVLVAGVVVIVGALCVRFARYITAQPDENTL